MNQPKPDTSDYCPLAAKLAWENELVRRLDAGLVLSKIDRKEAKRIVEIRKLAEQAGAL